MLYILLYGILENEKLSQRPLEDTFNLKEFSEACPEDYLLTIYLKTFLIQILLKVLLEVLYMKDSLRLIQIKRVYDGLLPCYFNIFTNKKYAIGFILSAKEKRKLVELESLIVEN